jgi:hypothetical protein
MPRGALGALRCELGATVLRASLLLIRLHCVGATVLRDPRTSRRSDDRFFDFAERNSKTSAECISGRQDLNLRPRGPKPRALPS